MRTVQIRTYTVLAGRLDEWVELWRTRIVPLRLEFGFQIPNSWVDRERNAHIWVISYDGEMSFAEANAAYWASPKRDALGVDPAEFLVGEQTCEVEPVL